MSTQDILSYLSFTIGVFGIIVALYQGFERNKLKQHIYSQAWHIFSITNLSLASTQAALKIYKDGHSEHINIQVLESLSKCEAHNSVLFIETIRQIQLTEPKFNIETIFTWAHQGKIHKDQMPYFIRIMPQEKISLISLLWKSITAKFKQKLLNKINTLKQEKASTDKYVNPEH